MQEITSNKLSFSPECVKIRCTSRRAISSFTPSPVIQRKKSCKKYRPSIKKYPLAQNPLISLSSISKCMYVNSILKSSSMSSNRKSGKSLTIHSSRNNFSHTEDSLRETVKRLINNNAKSRPRLTYYRISHNLIPQTNAICKQLFNEFSLSLRGSHINN
ncbi:hypothetical protein SteCoe_795 [Stentor coeruleus]|uniref:Uncharacterized protein n=1 Tax=Stentor coeruleus TaxID=5963 RepID=A0A1R2D395_9CILI|nr:hypothetical protein SteCoe_795 [Stentor coeruleus]